MTSNLKYGSKQVFWDISTKQVISKSIAERYRVRGKLKLPNHIERFDSILEFNVYQKLLDLYEESRIVRQYPLEIIPAGYCYPKGKKWRVDFAIQSAYNPKEFCCYVEAKGALLPDFRHTLASLETHSDRDFYRVRIVWGHDIPKDSVFIINLLATDFSNHMYSFNQFVKIRNLL